MIYNSVWRVCLCILSSPSCVFDKNNRGDVEALAILFLNFTTSKAVPLPKQLHFNHLDTQQVRRHAWGDTQ